MNTIFIVKTDTTGNIISKGSLADCLDAIEKFYNNSLCGTVTIYKNGNPYAYAHESSDYKSIFKMDVIKWKHD